MEKNKGMASSASTPIQSKIAWRQQKKICKKDSLFSSRLSIYQTCHIQKRQKNKSHGKEKQSGMASSASTPPLPSKIAWRQQKKKCKKDSFIFETVHLPDLPHSKTAKEEQITWKRRTKRNGLFGQYPSSTK